jgi:dihydrofolate reductase
MTGRIIIDLFTTLDGVAQAPGAPEEDTSSGFRFGGWQAPLPSEAVMRSVTEGMNTLDALLLGRRTYDIFAGYWPHHTTGPEGFIGQLFDRVPKYVASRDAAIQLDWQGSSRVGTDLPAELAALRAASGRACDRQHRLRANPAQRAAL